MKPNTIDMTTLIITGTDLTTNTEKTIELTSSNPYMLSSKYSKATNQFYIESWKMYRCGFESGNKGLNAGAYLCDSMEELTGMNLA